MRTSFPEVEIRSRTMQEHAETMLLRIRHLSIGKPAPEIHGEDVFGKEFKLSDYRGRVLMSRLSSLTLAGITSKRSTTNNRPTFQARPRTADEEQVPLFHFSFKSMLGNRL